MGECLKISPLVLLLAGALIGALAWGNCNAGRASDAQKALDAALAEHQDSLDAWHVERSALAVARDSLRVDSASLARALSTARVLGQRGRDSAAKLLALLPDSQRLGLEPVIRTLSLEGEACRELLANCELRAANAEARVHGDSLQLRATQLLLDSVGVAWHTEQRKNRPGFLGLRSFWHARSWTIPLAAISALLVLTHR